LRSCLRKLDHRSLQFIDDAKNICLPGFQRCKGFFAFYLALLQLQDRVRKVNRVVFADVTHVNTLRIQSINSLLASMIKSRAGEVEYNMMPTSQYIKTNSLHIATDAPAIARARIFIDLLPLDYRIRFRLIYYSIKQFLANPSSRRQHSTRSRSCSGEQRQHRLMSMRHQ